MIVTTDDAGLFAYSPPMTKISFVLVAALAAVGCKKGAGGGGGDCDKAISHSMDLSKDDMKKMGVDDAMMGKMADLAKQHCKDDKWSGEAVTCMVDAKTEADAQGCYDKLTKDQRDKMNKAAMALQPAAAPTPPTPTEPATPPTPTEGSAGSAGSGSAAP